MVLYFSLSTDTNKYIKGTCNIDVKCRERHEDMIITVMYTSYGPLKIAKLKPKEIQGGAGFVSMSS